jgi:nitrogen fixation/metabolism regulation signal transduction histidine kinase
MIYRAYFAGVIIRLIIQTTLAVLVGYFLSGNLWFLMAIAALCTLLFAIHLVYYMNVVNRELRFYFDAIRNGDTNLQMKKQVKNRSLKELHESMNRVKEHIANIKRQNESRERFFGELLRGSASGLMAIDASGYVELANDSALKMLGLPVITHIKRLQQYNDELYKLIISLPPGESKTLKLAVHGGIKQLAFKASVFKYDENSYKLFSINDIKAQLEESEMVTWQKMIRVLTHEIMNSVAPITSLGNSLKRFLILNGESKSPEQITAGDIGGMLQGLEVIEERGQGLLDFVDDYRMLTKLPKPRFAKVHTAQWIQKIGLLVATRLQAEHIHFRTESSYTHKTFSGDEKLLTQVLINLIYNAIEAMHQTRTKQLTLKATDYEGGSLSISVTDNGKGIPADCLDQVFLPFYTTKHEGSGIGLSLSKQIMHMHKGTLEVYSVPHEQTTFKMQF